ncbi:hypothetical protein TELCIR_20280 [Teladorsagia circumcincta]|uniref:Uncharacterized protein n=1 Tax=Teladorsagia circumcincta TaxID=45464 RepID=A0A2G9TK81_TELCI|nr:hypothetical protein TELCIR_20280 [Teladorsagia circumcincta]
MVAHVWHRKGPYARCPHYIEILTIENRCTVTYRKTLSLVFLLFQMNAKLVEDSRLMEKWTNPEYEILFKVYVHSIKNPDEIMNGAIPEVTESGPYTFTKKVTNKVSAKAKF